VAGFAIDAVVMEQNGQLLYCFVMGSDRLRRISYVTPRSKDDPEEIQRLVDVRRAKKIGEYIKQDNAVLPNAIVVSLTDEVEVRKTGKKGVETLHFPSEEGKFAYILDGQHRLEGFKYSDGRAFDLPVVALHGADDSLRGKVFADINSKQVPVSDVNLLSLYYQIKDATADETAVMDVLIPLNGDQNSPLRGKIKMMDQDKGTWIKNSAMNRLISPHLEGGVLAGKNSAQRTQIFKNYFSAIKATWPEAWGDNRKYNLCKTVGFEIMLGVFPFVIRRCDLNMGASYTADNMVKMMEPLSYASIEMPGGNRMQLDWLRGGQMAVIGNAATKAIAVRQLRKILAQADEQEDEDEAKS